jgi:CBS domain-containing protein
VLKIASIMTRRPAKISSDSSIDKALDLMRKRTLRHVLVMDHERLVGIVSERDLMGRPGPPARVRSEDEPRSAEAVRDLMRASVEIATADEPVQEACRRMRDLCIGCLPVLLGGRVAGVLSESDLLKLYVRTCEFGGHEPDFDPLVADVMSEKVISVEPRESAAAAWEICRTKRIRHLPVVADGWFVGIVSDRDLLEVAGGVEGEARKVGDLMSKEFVAIPPDAPLSRAALSMIQHRLHALPVLAKGSLRGIVTSTDVLGILAAVEESKLESAWSGEQALGAGRVEE